ncbi:hypothetical protein EVAR_16220_1 [Eumeta japonica]|uniref:Uncharacterized protein n=1 Tax=Eumeta variegata TaxID=151549 RepID=A0A4C1U5L3_EUMVA|nr:hypothetical protein EVAR_16220_1 [Eumeta japonica]
MPPENNFNERATRIVIEGSVVRRPPDAQALDQTHTDDSAVDKDIHGAAARNAPPNAVQCVFPLVNGDASRRTDIWLLYCGAAEEESGRGQCHLDNGLPEAWVQSAECGRECGKFKSLALAQPSSPSDANGRPLTTGFSYENVLSKSPAGVRVRMRERSRVYCTLVLTSASINLTVLNHFNRSTAEVYLPQTFYFRLPSSELKTPTPAPIGRGPLRTVVTSAMFTYGLNTLSNLTCLKTR